MTIRDGKVCSVAGTLSAGAICAHTLTSETNDLSMDEFLDFLEAEPERPDPNNPSQTLPAHGAALCMSPADWNLMKTELEQACREMGTRCTLAVQKLIVQLKSP